MTTSPHSAAQPNRCYLIAERAPEFPCWLWHRPILKTAWKWTRFLEAPREICDGALALVTHWSPDQPAAPTLTPADAPPPPERTDLTPTPRTDGHISSHLSTVIIRAGHNPGHYIDADFARQLERELNEARDARRDEESWCAEKHNYQARAEKAESQLASAQHEISHMLVAQKEYQIDGENLNSLRAQLEQALHAIDHVLLPLKFFDDVDADVLAYARGKPLNERVAGIAEWMRRQKQTIRDYVALTETTQLQSERIEVLEAQLATHPSEEAIAQHPDQRVRTIIGFTATDCAVVMSTICGRRPKRH